MALAAARSYDQYILPEGVFPLSSSTLAHLVSAPTVIPLWHANFVNELKKGAQHLGIKCRTHRTIDETATIAFYDDHIRKVHGEPILSLPPLSECTVWYLHPDDKIRLFMHLLVTRDLYHMKPEEIPECVRLQVVQCLTHSWLLQRYGSKFEKNPLGFGKLERFCGPAVSWQELHLLKPTEFITQEAISQRQALHRTNLGCHIVDGHVNYFTVFMIVYVFFSVHFHADSSCFSGLFNSFVALLGGMRVDVDIKDLKAQLEAARCILLGFIHALLRGESLPTDQASIVARVAYMRVRAFEGVPTLPVSRRTWNPAKVDILEGDTMILKMQQCMHFAQLASYRKFVEAECTDTQDPIVHFKIKGMSHDDFKATMRLLAPRFGNYVSGSFIHNSYGHYTLAAMRLSAAENIFVASALHMAGEGGEDGYRSYFLTPHLLRRLCETNRLSVCLLNALASWFGEVELTQIDARYFLETMTDIFSRVKTTDTPAIILLGRFIPILLCRHVSQTTRDRAQTANALTVLYQLYDLEMPEATSAFVHGKGAVLSEQLVTELFALLTNPTVFYSKTTFGAIYTLLRVWHIDSTPRHLIPLMDNSWETKPSQVGFRKHTDQPLVSFETRRPIIDCKSGLVETGHLSHWYHALLSLEQNTRGSQLPKNTLPGYTFEEWKSDAYNVPCFVGHQSSERYFMDTFCASVSTRSSFILSDGFLALLHESRSDIEELIKDARDRGAVYQTKCRCLVNTAMSPLSDDDMC